MFGRSRSPRKSTAFLGTATVIAVVVAAGVFAPPYLVRLAVVNYLKSQGLSVQIKDVDANLLTGQITLDGVHAENDHGHGFTIGHLGLNVGYLPLYKQRLVIESLTLRDARVDVTRTADNDFRIAGISLSQGKKKSSSHSGWRFGLEKLRLGGLAIHYHQAATDSSAAIDRVITLNDSRAGDVITWDNDHTIPLDTTIGIGGGTLHIAGHISPFGSTRSASLHIVAQNFPVELVAPLTRRAGITKASGRLDADQHVDVSYAKDQPLRANVNGHIAFHKLSVSRTGDVHAKARLVAWHGKAEAKVLRPNGAPGEIDTRGKFRIEALAMHRGNSLELSADHADYQGHGETIIDQPLRISTHGRYNDQNIHLEVGHQIKLSAKSEKLTGDIETTVGKRTTVVTDGKYLARKLSFAIPDSLKFGSRDLDWNGTTQTTLAGGHTRIDTHGDLDSKALDFILPKTSRFEAATVHWKGETHIDNGQLFVHNAEGRLVTFSPRLEIPGAPILFKADDFVFDGRYGQQPTASGKSLAIQLDGDASTARLKVMDTAIDSAWMSALQTHIRNIRVDGLSDIRVAGVKTSGLRLLEDTDSNAAVVQAVTLDAKQLRLDDMSRYRLASMEIGEAIVHVRRDKQGMGVISEFLGGGQKSSSKKSSSKKNSSEKNKSKSSSGSKSGASSTYAVDHFAITGPAVYFTDTTTDPKVHLIGHDLDFSVDGLDTGHPSQDANFQFSLDLGAYGHLDSRGSIAPLAPGGMDADFSAWLRSLAMPPLSGYLNEAMGRKIARGAIDGTLDLKANSGQLNGTLNATIANFRLANDDQKTTEIVLGINMETALALIRGQDDEFHFQTKILGDVTNPYFSIDNLVREAILAGLRTALLSNYSPIGLVARVKTLILNLFRSVESRPAVFREGMHYVRPQDRHYLGLIAQAMDQHPTWRLTIQGQATLADAKAMSLSALGADANTDTPEDSDGAFADRLKLRQLARLRAQAVRDYLAARGVNTDNLIRKPPVVAEDKDARPVVHFKLDKKGHDKKSGN